MQLVAINDCYSFWTRIINVGAPQTSILEPLLFLICINDLKNHKFLIIEWGEIVNIFGDIYTPHLGLTSSWLVSETEKKNDYYITEGQQIAASSSSNDKSPCPKTS